MKFFHYRTLLILIGLLTVAAYSSSFRVPFVYDDHRQIVNSPLIKSFEFFPRLFSSDYFSLSPKRYRPATVGAYFLFYSVWRLDPWGYHLTKLGLHLLNVFLLFAYFRTLKLDGRASAWGIALFALHPVQIEAITPISFLDDSLMTFWFFLALIASFRALADNGEKARRWYLLSLFSYLLALASKELALVFPFFVFLQCVLFRFPDRGRKGGFWAGYLIISVAWAVIRFGYMNQGGWLSLQAEKSGDRLLLPPATLLHYLRVSLIPVNLCLDYVLPLPTGIFTIPAPLVLLLVAGMIILLLKFIFKSGYCLLGVSLFIVPLLPVSNFLAQPKVAADRYLYLPLAGLSLLAAALIHNLEKDKRFKRSRRFFAPASGLILLFWAGLTYRQNLLWQNPGLLWEDTLIHSPASVTARNNLGWFYFQGGEYQPARREFERTLALKPPPPIRAATLTNLAYIQWSEGLSDKALESLELALEASPDYARAYYTLGYYRYLQGDQEAALGHYRRALELAPYDYLVHDYIAGLLSSLGRLDEAERFSRQAVKLNPDYALGYDHLGIIYAKQGKIGPAREEWRRALRLDRKLESARMNLAASEGGKGDER